MEKSKVLELHNQVVESVANFRKCEADLIEKLADVQRYEIYKEFGYRTLFLYCTEKLRLSDAVTSNLITVMRKAEEVPELKQMIKDGEVGVSKARKICSALSKSNKDEWLPKLKSFSTRQLEKEVADNIEKEPTENIKRIAKQLSRLNLDIDDETRELLERAVELASKKAKNQQTKIDTVKLALKEYVEKHDPAEKSKRNQVKLENTQEDSNKSMCHVNREGEKTSVKIKPESVSSIDENGNRTQIPMQIQHDYIAKYGCRCRYTGCDGHECGSTAWLEWHHIKPVSEGGEHSVDNLILLCSCHHKLVHKSGSLIL
jgi:hypothetical protein